MTATRLLANRTLPRISLSRLLCGHADPALRAATWLLTLNRQQGEVQLFPVIRSRAASGLNRHLPDVHGSAAFVARLDPLTTPALLLCRVAAFTLAPVAVVEQRYRTA
jgi:hypothetical protein